MGRRGGKEIAREGERADDFIGIVRIKRREKIVKTCSKTGNVSTRTNWNPVACERNQQQRSIASGSIAGSTWYCITLSTERRLFMQASL